jgi:ribosome biogenesis SPOUT family RNA methylase Rps3
MKPEKLAEWMHDEYEKIAREEGWETQASTKVVFKDLPEQNKNVMLELAKRLIIKFAQDTHGK